jgi:cephalosporin-C deacetylase-like acetyl esterase
LIDGFLSIPQGKGKFPAVIGVPGAGSGVTGPYPYIRSKKKAIELFMNVHPFKTCKTSQEMFQRYSEMNKSFKTKSYIREYSWDRNKYIFRKVWLALSRAADYVAQLPEFDGKNFASTGHSQGGGTALAVAYLNKNISCVASSEPAICDHSGYLEKRQSGWPALHNTLKGRADKVSPYFDCATFAAGIKVPSILAVGYVDRTCSPSSVYSAYNNITAQKTIIPMYVKGHRMSPHAMKLMRRFLDKHLTK